MYLSVVFYLMLLRFYFVSRIKYSELWNGEILRFLWRSGSEILRCAPRFMPCCSPLFTSVQLLLRKTGDATPLLHAMRIGHQDIAIILLGAFSRYINNLQDEEMALPRTRTRLKALRKIVFTRLSGVSSRHVQARTSNSLSISGCRRLRVISSRLSSRR